MNRVTQAVRKLIKPAQYIIGLIFLALASWILWKTYQANNLGFTSKTLWDWMELLLIPFVLALAGFWFSYSQNRENSKIAEEERENDRKIALEKQRQQTLENYLDRMKELILDRNLGSGANPEVKRLARTLTLNILQELTAKRNQQVIQFLQELRLIKKTNNTINESREISLSKARLYEVDLYGIDLSNVDLSETNLQWATLTWANLQSANLSNANLREARLNEATLTSANLSGAQLGEANLYGARLCEAVLYGANLAGADLRGTDLYGAKLNTANLSGANLHQSNATPAMFDGTVISNNTIMPNGHLYGEWKLDQT
ncbi:MAG: pentapeptide repeat-containing protein [Chloroflexota bacterium]